MRKTFVNALIDLATNDERIVLLTGDLGFMVMEPFIERFPNRFVNVGVAEQNMVGVATGMAESGMIPYVYSITPFAVLRPYEFIRNGPIYHQLKVRIIGVGAGLEYGHDGISHFGIDDIGVLRVQPGISIFAPADYQQADSIFRKTWDMRGPIYYRLSKDEKSVVPNLSAAFEIGEAQFIENGNDILIVTLGTIALEAAKAIELLKISGVHASLLMISSINPPPLASLSQILPKFKKIITAESHYINGGIGSMIAEFIAEKSLHCTLIRCGIDHIPNGQIGHTEYLLQTFGIDEKSIAAKALSVLQGKNI